MWVGGVALGGKVVSRVSAVGVGDSIRDDMKVGDTAKRAAWA